MKNTSGNKARARGRLSVREFDLKFERGEDISGFLDFKKAVVVKRVNVDFPVWMIKRLDDEALKLNVSRQAIIKMWIHEHLAHPAAHKHL
ncbi:MAG: CopG family transcriptional regulator [Elusimicrobia bacterium]|nr:CopG family transcriptional regulator [Elusimicrobiota bacterium]